MGLGQERMVGDGLGVEVREAPGRPWFGGVDPAWWWGVDVSTKRVAIGGVDAAGSRFARSIDVDDRLRGGQRHDALYMGAMALTHGFRWHFPPLVVWVEQPAAFGRQPEPELYYAVGVVQAALYSALRSMFEHPVWVETVPIGRWRKAALGSGAAKKQDVLTWAASEEQAQRFVGRSWENADEAEAAAIGEAARRMVRFGDG